MGEKSPKLVTLNFPPLSPAQQKARQMSNIVNLPPRTLHWTNDLLALSFATSHRVKENFFLLFFGKHFVLLKNTQ
jgi:hypothetical protein